PIPEQSLLEPGVLNAWRVTAGRFMVGPYRNPSSVRPVQINRVAAAARYLVGTRQAGVVKQYPAQLNFLFQGILVDRRNREGAQFSENGLLIQEGSRPLCGRAT